MIYIYLETLFSILNGIIITIISIQQIYRETKKSGIFYFHHRFSLVIGLLSLTEFISFIDYSNIIIIILNRWLLDCRTMFIFLAVKITTMYIYVFSCSIKLNETSSYDFKNDKLLKPYLYNFYMFLFLLTIISCQLPTIFRIIYMKQKYSYFILINNVISLFFTTLIINKKLFEVYTEINYDILSGSDEISNSIKRLKIFQLFFTLVSLCTISYSIFLFLDIYKSDENITENLGSSFNFIKIAIFLGVYISLWFSYIPDKKRKKNTITISTTNNGSPKLVGINVIT
jgi:hypothetical protein